MSAKQKCCAGVSSEINEALEDYAKKHGLNKAEGMRQIFRLFFKAQRMATPPTSEDTQ
jgi:hypothetical protein